MLPDMAFNTLVHITSNNWEPYYRVEEQKSKKPVLPEQETDSQK